MKKRAENRGSAPALWRGCALVLLCLFSPGARSQATTPVTAGVWADAVNWDLKGTASEETEGAVTQTLTGIWVNFPLARSVDARFELASSPTSSPGSSLGFGDLLAGALVLRYKSSNGRWRLHGGIGSSSVRSDLADDQWSLAQLMGDPVLGFADPVPIRGWRFHLSGLAGAPLSRVAHLYGGAGYQAFSPYEPTGDIRLEPGSRFTGLVGLSLRWRSGRLGAELTGGIDGEETAEGFVVRSRRDHYGAIVTGETVWGAARLGFQGGVSRTGPVSWPDPQDFARSREAGAGKWSHLRLLAASADRLSLGRAWRLLPSLVLTHRRYQPDELPVGEGWSVEIMPVLDFHRSGKRLRLGVGWHGGEWSAWRDGGREARESIHGWRLKVELSGDLGR